MPPSELEILVVDDDDEDVMLVRDYLGQGRFAEGVRVQHCSSAADALARLERGRFDVLLVDYRLGDGDGLSVLRRARARGVTTPAVFLTGQGDEVLAVEAMKAGAVDYLSKARLRPEMLNASVRYAVDLERARRERELAEERLRQAEARYRGIFESAIEGIFQSTRAGRLLSANPALARILGYPSPESLIATAFDMARDVYADPARHAELVRLLDERGAVHGFEVQLRRRDGSLTWARVNVGAVRDEQGQLSYYEGLVEDVTERKEAELRLRESERQYRLLFDSNPHPMWVLDAQTRKFLAVNDAAVRHYGWSREEFLAMTGSDLRAEPRSETAAPSHPDAVGQDGERVLSGGEWKHRAKDGRELLVDITFSPIEFQRRPAFLVLAQDVTRTRGLQAQLLQAQKLEAVGRLAGGVAHDFNNLLMAISGFAELSRQDTDPGSRVARNLEEIGKAADRAATLTRQLLAFSRRQVLEPRLSSLSAIVAGLEKLLRRLIGEDVTLSVDCAEGTGQVRADPGQMEQVLMNLVVNARDAMPRGGRLTITTRDAVVDSSFADSHVGLAPGAYVVLSVADTGSGMDEKTRAHIFEPFFTTKEPGQGSGLGLSTVHGIVQQSGGAIHVESEVGRGTSFQIFLPRAESTAEPAIAAPLPDLPRGSETILLVEDDQLVRQVTRALLESGGYRVLAAGGAEEALRICRDYRGKIDLLFTDVVMPEKSGRELAEEAQPLRPDMKVIYTSGYTDDAILRHGLLQADLAFIHKPFTREALARKLREVLDQRD
jgi:PAS domain S-box-containing protein